MAVTGRGGNRTDDRKGQKQLRRAGDSPLKGSNERFKVHDHDLRERVYRGRLNLYYTAVIASVRNAESILMFGLGEAKRELKERPQEDDLGGRIAAVETPDKMTHRQIAARLRKLYAK